MRSWINHLSNHDRYLHKVAKQVVRSEPALRGLRMRAQFLYHGLQATDIQSFVQKNPTLGFTLILQLTGTNGNRQFDRVTKTKTVESILASMDAKGVEIYIDYLLQQVNNTSDEKSVSTF
jgi:DNA polymerase phi